MHCEPAMVRLIGFREESAMLVLKISALLLALAAVGLESGYAQSVRMSYTGTPGFTTPFWLTYEAGLLKNKDCAAR
jgi:hypothetical protein